jgi:hypothetical protein
VDTDAGRKEHIKWKEEKLKDLKSKLEIINKKTTNSAFDFKLDRMDNMEEKMKFKMQMDKMGLSHLSIHKYLSNMQTMTALKRLLMAKSKN